MQIKRFRDTDSTWLFRLEFEAQIKIFVSQTRASKQITPKKKRSEIRLIRKQNTDKCLYFFLFLFSLVLFSSLGKQTIVMHFIFLKKSKTKQSESENSQTKISPGQISRDQIY